VRIDPGCSGGLPGEAPYSASRLSIACSTVEHMSAMLEKRRDSLDSRLESTVEQAMERRLAECGASSGRPPEQSVSILTDSPSASSA